MWSVTGWDWDAPPADVIVEKVTKQIKGATSSCCTMADIQRQERTVNKP